MVHNWRKGLCAAGAAIGQCNLSFYEFGAVFAVTVINFGSHLFFVITLVLFLSALTRSTIGTMALLLAGLIIPAFIPFSKESGLFNHVLALAIVRMVDLKECLVSFLDYRIGSVILDLPTVSILVHMAVAVVLVLFLRKIFVRRSIQA